MDVVSTAEMTVTIPGVSEEILGVGKTTEAQDA